MRVKRAQKGVNLPTWLVRLRSFSRLNLEHLNLTSEKIATNLICRLHLDLGPYFLTRDNATLIV